MADLAELAVRVTSTGIEKVKGDLSSLGATGEATSQRLGGLTKSYESMTARAQDFARAGASGSQIMQLTGASAAEAERAVRVYGTTLARTAEEAELLKAAQSQMALASMNVAAATNLHGLSLGRLNSQLGSAVGRMSGLGGIAGRLGAQIGGAAAGYGPMILLVGAIYAASKAYEYFTADAKAAKEAQDKLTDSLRKWYETKEHGEAGERNRQGGALRAQLAEDQAALAKAQTSLGLLQATSRNPGAQGGPQTIGGADKAELASRVAELQATIADEQKILKAADADGGRLIAEADDRKKADYAQSLADRVTFNRKDAALRQTALEELRRDRVTLRDLLTLPETPENSARIQQYEGIVKQLSGALDPKVKETAPERLDDAIAQRVAKLHAETASLLQENAARASGVGALNAWRVANAGVAAVAELSAKATAQETQAVRAAAEAHERAAIAAEAYAKGASAIASLRERTDAQLAENRALLEGSATSETATIAKQYEKDVTDALAESTAALVAEHYLAAGAARDAALAHVKITDELKKEAAATKSVAAEESHVLDTMLKDMQRSVGSFFERAFSGQLVTVRSFFADVKSLFIKTLADMEAAAVMKKASGALASWFGIGGAIGSASGGITQGNAATAAQQAGQIAAGLPVFPSSDGGSALAKSLGKGAAEAGVGFGIGNIIGSQTTNSGVGALGGAAGGAAAGFMMGGPVGAIIGGAAGLVGGFLGAKNAAKALAEAQDQARLALLNSQTGLAQWRASLSQSVADQRAAAKLEVQLKYESQRQEIDNNLKGKKNENERAREQAEALNLYNTALKQATAGIEGFTGALNEVLGYKATLNALIYANAPTTGGGSGGSGGGSGDPTGLGGARGGSGSSGGSVGGGVGAQYDQTINVNVDGKTIAQVVLKNLKAAAQRATGDTTKWSTVQVVT